MNVHRVATHCITVNWTAVNWIAVNSIAINTNVFWIQTIIVNDDSNSVLGDFDVIPPYLIEVRQLAAAGNKLAAVKLYKESTGLGLKEAKDWVDNNC